MKTFTPFKDKVDPKLINSMSWLGTSLVLVGPYLISTQASFIPLMVGIVLLTPQVYVKKQWNLVLLNLSSVIAYGIQVFN